MIISIGSGDMSQEKACCFTGHRFLPRNDITKINTRIAGIISLLYSQGVRHFYNGGAMGFDLLTAQAVLAERQRMDGIQVLVDDNGLIN